MRKISKNLVVFAILISMLSLSTIAARAEGNEYQLWTNKDQYGWGVNQYYDGPSIYFGQIHHEWMTNYIPTNDPQYDYYAIYVLETLNPSYNQGNGVGTILYGTTEFKLTASNEMIVQAIPYATTGAAVYGTSVSIGPTGPTFSATQSYSCPDVTINPNTDARWGGSQIWSFNIKRNDLVLPGAQGAQTTLYFTALVRIDRTQGEALQATVTLGTEWASSYYLIPVFMTFYETFTIHFAVRAPPTINTPVGISYSQGQTGNTITWAPTDDDPQNYSIYKYSVNTGVHELVQNASWRQEKVVDGLKETHDSQRCLPVTCSVDGLQPGTYNYTCTVQDCQAHKTSSKPVTVIVTPDTVQPTFVSPLPADVSYYNDDPGPIYVTWSAYDAHPGNYAITRDGGVVASGQWSNGVGIQIDVSGLGAPTRRGTVVLTFAYVCTVKDLAGNSNTDTVLVKVTCLPYT